ncbi:hypothetical protein Ciccas_002525 [Cichlidogyrus casuarinus]|uniref:Uncharacterized protein n=1 Tax=Cichlidogyrus casuarinus TaxID=1844966 RepID=A0ABD2QGY6_9PLAT
MNSIAIDRKSYLEVLLTRCSYDKCAAAAKGDEHKRNLTPTLATLSEVCLGFNNIASVLNGHFE